ncbi:hypothetical protein WS54_06990 [Burkholderia sp. NRF60-BP8]|nr:hypothetical protein WS54_06990 [Burkholderia sp. NRF60-BP8]KVA07156.1 hypothetical protein WS54_23615 [Burkholderia sp. NRF60-BP8]
MANPRHRKPALAAGTARLDVLLGFAFGVVAMASLSPWCFAGRPFHMHVAHGAAAALPECEAWLVARGVDRCRCGLP